MVGIFSRKLGSNVLVVSSNALFFIWGDNESYQIVGKTKFKIKFQNRNHWLLHEVRHVPRLSGNLILEGKLSDEGCVVTFDDKN